MRSASILVCGAASCLVSRSYRLSKLAMGFKMITLSATALCKKKHRMSMCLAQSLQPTAPSDLAVLFGPVSNHCPVIFIDNSGTLLRKFKFVKQVQEIQDLLNHQ